MNTLDEDIKTLQTLKDNLDKHKKILGDALENANARYKLEVINVSQQYSLIMNKLRLMQEKKFNTW